MGMMTRRLFTTTALLGAVPALAEDAPVTLRGKLTQAEGKPPALTLADGRAVQLEGDEQTTGVLHDPRLKDIDFEATGHLEGDTKLRILPIHKRALYVHKNGKRLFVTYWCEVCAIRTYTPGTCWCCQDDTALDLLEKLDN
jgi:hypothetical protein